MTEQDPHLLDLLCGACGLFASHGGDELPAGEIDRQTGAMWREFHRWLRMHRGGSRFAPDRFCFASYGLFPGSRRVVFTPRNPIS
jgi:hypothetical protein